MGVRRIPMDPPSLPDGSVGKQTTDTCRDPDLKRTLGVGVKPRRPWIHTDAHDAETFPTQWGFGAAVERARLWRGGAELHPHLFAILYIWIGSMKEDLALEAIRKIMKTLKEFSHTSYELEEAWAEQNHDELSVALDSMQEHLRRLISEFFFAETLIRHSPDFSSQEMFTGG